MLTKGVKIANKIQGISRKALKNREKVGKKGKNRCTIQDLLSLKGHCRITESREDGDKSD